MSTPIEETIYADYEPDLELGDEEEQHDSDECWSCGATRFGNGYGGMTICLSCKEIQDEDEDEFSRDDRYDHW